MLQTKDIHYTLHPDTLNKCCVLIIFGISHFLVSIQKHITISESKLSPPCKASLAHTANLEIDGAPTGGRRQVNLELGEELLVLGHPVAQDVRVVGRDDRHF